MTEGTEYTHSHKTTHTQQTLDPRYANTLQYAPEKGFISTARP